MPLRKAAWSGPPARALASVIIVEASSTTACDQKLRVPGPAGVQRGYDGCCCKIGAPIQSHLFKSLPAEPVGSKIKLENGTMVHTG
jgi:hypothetical protein